MVAPRDSHFPLPALSMASWHSLRFLLLEHVMHVDHNLRPKCRLHFCWHLNLVQYLPQTQQQKVRNGIVRRRSRLLNLGENRLTNTAGRRKSRRRLVFPSRARSDNLCQDPTENVWCATRLSAGQIHVHFLPEPPRHNIWIVVGALLGLLYVAMQSRVRVGSVPLSWSSARDADNYTRGECASCPARYYRPAPLIDPIKH
jgi:hypothetical protein